MVDSDEKDVNADQRDETAPSTPPDFAWRVSRRSLVALGFCWGILGVPLLGGVLLGYGWSGLWSGYQVDRESSVVVLIPLTLMFVLIYFVVYTPTVVRLTSEWFVASTRFRTRRLKWRQVEGLRLRHDTARRPHEYILGVMHKGAWTEFPLRGAENTVLASLLVWVKWQSHTSETNRAELTSKPPRDV